MDRDLIATQEKDTFHYHGSNDMSTIDENNANVTNTYWPSYHAINTNQSQNQQPIIMTTEPVILLAGIIPTMYHNHLQPLVTDPFPIQAIQLPVETAVPNFSKEIGSPPDEIKRKFDLTPEIPDQIFTLPFLQLKTSESNDIQEQHMATSNLEQFTKLSALQELAERSDYSKKIPLSIEIPEDLPPRSMFPSYSTPLGGVVLKQIKCAETQSATTMNVSSGSSNVMLREIPHIVPNAQTTSYGALSHSSVDINQAVSNPVSLTDIAIPSGSNTNIQVQPTIQAQTTVPSILQHQPFIQNQNVSLQYSDPDVLIYRHAIEFHPTMNTSGTLQYQNINPPLYRHGTQASMESCPTYASIVSGSCKNTVSTENQLHGNLIPHPVSTENAGSLNLAQNPGLFMGIGNPIYTYTSNINL